MSHDSHVTVWVGSYGRHVTLLPAGSLVPFTLRLLHANLPRYVGKLQLAQDRLCSLQYICEQVHMTHVHRLLRTQAMTFNILGSKSRVIHRWNGAVVVAGGGQPSLVERPVSCHATCAAGDSRTDTRKTAGQH